MEIYIAGFISVILLGLLFRDGLGDKIWNWMNKES